MILYEIYHFNDIITIGDSVDNFFSIQMNNCINEFYKFYNQDNYISKKSYDLFLDKYKDIFSIMNKYSTIQDDNYKRLMMISQRGYEMVEIKNKKYVEQHLIDDKEYFDKLFINIDPNILLDEEQRKAILIDEDYSLIIAGAGSGKTTTMAAKVKYLIEKKGIDPNNIILLSFTKKATEELDSILNGKFNLNVEVLTFHKLGMKFIRNIVNHPVQIINDSGIYTYLSEYFIDIVFKDKILLQKYLIAFKDFLLLNETCLNYENYEDYYKDYMDLKYNECKDNLVLSNQKRIKDRLRYYKTINGEYVKSEGEFRIANYLYKNGIDYYYEKIYPYKLNNGHSYIPDFTIVDFDQTIYVEYYGLAKLNSDGLYYSEIKSYQDEIGQKRNTHLNNKTDLIELFSSYEQDNDYLSELSLQLNYRNVHKSIRTDKEIFYRLLETSKDVPYASLIWFLITFISLFKELNYSEEDFELLKSKTDDEIVRLQLDLIKEVYLFYQNKLRSNYKIDFQDMITYAYDNMAVIKDKKKFVNYDYVIIDEYQDISRQRYNFARKISDLFDAKIVAVGDDWQTIFSFSGSDIQLFTKFYELMGYAEIIKITNTYRNSQELIDLAGEFVCKNNDQISKSLKSRKHLKNPIELVGYDYSEKFDNLPYVLDKLINKIYADNPNDRILLLTRFNDEVYNLLDSKLFYKKSKSSDQIFCKSMPRARIDILSIHKSKGLGYDQVILLNALDITKGFPSKIKDKPVINLIKGNSMNLNEFTEHIEYPEERRLFYVAMTRTKNKLYIMTPNNFNYRSDFIKEIENNKNIVWN